MTETLIVDGAPGERLPAPVVMGIVNATPDSFSDGGVHAGGASAVAHGLSLVAEGAHIIDVGGESSRPGAAVVGVAEELDRVMPAIEGLVEAGLGAGGSAEISIDTVKPEVATAAVAAGATIVNDVSGELGLLAARLGVGWVSMHRQGSAADMQSAPHYDDVVAEVLASCVERAVEAVSAGAPRVWLDPGIGFGKSLQHNLELIASLDRFVDTGIPLLVGVSRKSMFGALGAVSDRRVGIEVEGAVPVDDRLDGSLAVAAWAAHLGAAVLRVHDVGPTVRALRVVTA